MATEPERRARHFKQKILKASFFWTLETSADYDNRSVRVTRQDDKFDDHGDFLNYRGQAVVCASCVPDVFQLPSQLILRR